MSRILTPCTASGKGEQRLARLLESFVDDKLLLCFSIDFVPGVREIDLLICHLDLGLFVIEVKAIPMHALKSVSHNSWQIEGRGSDESPLRQAYKQWEGLRSYWNARTSVKLPPVGVTACFPEISRHEWRRAFPENSYAGSLADGLLFSEDLVDAESLKRRLSVSIVSPPIRSGRPPSPPSAAFIERFEALLAPTPPFRPSASDRDRLRKIEQSINAQLRGEFPAEGTEYAVFSGAPGTGKTFRLLSIGLHHAYSNKRLLFVCFNKTLASDIRRLLSFEEKLNHVEHEVDVLDVNQLALRCFEMNGLSYLDSASADEWGRMVVESLETSGDTAVIAHYDTVLIDEAHDMQDWQLDLLRLHATPRATVCLALGQGQELYRDDSSALAWLESFTNDKPVKRKMLRRNFRNPSAQYFAALAFHLAWPDRLHKVAAAFDQVLGPGRGQSILEFDRDGEPLRYLPVPTIQGEFDHDGLEQDDLVSREYAQILQREIDAIEADENAVPVGILVLVPSEESQHARWARLALEQLTSSRDDISFIDYTDERLRRSMALSTEIRLCTFHSSRGLEGDRVVIFGLEQLEALTRATNVKPENLGFIALSRGVFYTTVVVRTFFTTATHTLLKEILKVFETNSQ